MNTHIELGQNKPRKPRNPASFEEGCEMVMRGWPDVWLHRFAVEWSDLWYRDGWSRQSAFAQAFQSVRGQIAAGKHPPICCAEAKRLADRGRAA